MGEFTCFDHPAAEVPLPLRRQRHHAADVDGADRSTTSRCRADIVFVHNARTPADIVFRRELETMARQAPGFRFVPVCEADHRRRPGAASRAADAGDARS